ncbi:MAG: hypothetical protein ACHREM_06380 [Polyangiales bacterium]
MSARSSRLQVVLDTAYNDIERYGPCVRIVRVAGEALLVVASGLGRQVYIDDRTIQMCQEWAVLDPVHAPLIYSLRGVHIGVLFPRDGMLIDAGPGE